MSSLAAHEANVYRLGVRLFYPLRKLFPQLRFDKLEVAFQFLIVYVQRSSEVQIVLPNASYVCPVFCYLCPARTACS